MEKHTVEWFRYINSKSEDVLDSLKGVEIYDIKEIIKYLNIKLDSRIDSSNLLQELKKSYFADYAIAMADESRSC